MFLLTLWPGLKYHVSLIITVEGYSYNFLLLLVSSSALLRRYSSAFRTIRVPTSIKKGVQESNRHISGVWLYERLSLYSTVLIKKIELRPPGGKPTNGVPVPSLFLMLQRNTLLVYWGPVPVFRQWETVHNLTRRTTRFPYNFRRPETGSVGGE